MQSIAAYIFAAIAEIAGCFALHGVIDDAKAEVLKKYLTPVLNNWAGKYAGDLRPAF